MKGCWSREIVGRGKAGGSGWERRCLKFRLFFVCLVYFYFGKRGNRGSR